MAGLEGQLKKILREHGCTFVRQGKGDHEIWYSPKTGIRFPVDSGIKSRHTFNGILKRAGIDEKI